ncbi:hypothetical protein CFE70_003435 [Pyrenophora teres f. teres 0-1]
MDRPKPAQRPPDAPMNYHSQTSQAYPAYASLSQSQSQSQPQQQQQQQQQPVHAPYAQQDPYSVPRRDPFYPSAPQHVRHGSQGGQAPLAGNKTPQGQAEGQQGQGGWPGTGTEALIPPKSTFAFAQYQGRAAGRREEQMREAIACMDVLHDTSIAKSTSPPIARGLGADAGNCRQMLLR